MHLSPLSHTCHKVALEKYVKMWIIAFILPRSQLKRIRRPDNSSTATFRI